MPLYAFRCTACDHAFDQLLSLRDDQEAVRCPECRSSVRRVVSVFATSSRGGDFSAAPPVGGG